MLKVKRVFFYGLSKSLCRAATELKIPIFEFQHGEITDATICYTYKIKPRNFIYPTKLLTFSNEWVNGKSIPYDCVEIGSMNNYKINYNILRDSNSIVILSSPHQGDLLLKLAFEISKFDSKLIIFFKLHPMEFEKYEYYKFSTINFCNIQIVDLALNIIDVLSLSDDFVLIYSTTLFEIIQSGKNAYLYSHHKFNQENLSLNKFPLISFESAEDLIFKIKNKHTNPNKLNSLVYFKPFNKSAFIRAIAN